MQTECHIFYKDELLHHEYIMSLKKKILKKLKKKRRRIKTKRKRRKNLQKSGTPGFVDWLRDVILFVKWK